MSLPKGAMRVAAVFGKAVVKKKWAEILPLLSAEARSKHTAESLAAEFGWEHLMPRLNQMHTEITGEVDDIELDPPARYEVFEVEERDPPAGHDPTVPVGWMEVDFHPSEDSEFDLCYNCFLAFVDEGGAKIAAFVIESATE